MAASPRPAPGPVPLERPGPPNRANPGADRSPSTFDSVRRRPYIASMNKSAVLVLSALALAGAGCESEAQKAANAAGAEAALDAAKADSAAILAAEANAVAALDAANTATDNKHAFIEAASPGISGLDFVKAADAAYAKYLAAREAARTYLV